MHALHSSNAAPAFPPPGLEYDRECNWHPDKPAVRVVLNHQQQGEKFWHLSYDAAGKFYALESNINADGFYTERVCREMTGTHALRFLLRCISRDDAFTNDVLRALSQPEFEFHPPVQVNPKAKRKRARKAAPKLGAVQLEMATGLVQVLRDFIAKPTTERLCAACRAASEVHQSLHAPENFKLAAQG